MSNQSTEPSPLVQAPELHPLDLFPTQSEEWKMMNEPGTQDSTPRVDFSLLQPVGSAENLKMLGTPPLRRTLSIVPSSPEDWKNYVHLDLTHASNADLVGEKRKRMSSV
jgi:hypothetical protein